MVDQEFRHNIVKVAVDPLGNSRVDLQTQDTVQKVNLYILIHPRLSEKLKHQSGDIIPLGGLQEK